MLGICACLMPFPFPDLSPSLSSLGQGPAVRLCLQRRVLATWQITLPGRLLYAPLYAVYLRRYDVYMWWILVSVAVLVSIAECMRECECVYVLCLLHYVKVYLYGVYIKCICIICVLLFLYF